MGGEDIARGLLAEVAGWPEHAVLEVLELLPGLAEAAGAEAVAAFLEAKIEMFLANKDLLLAGELRILVEHQPQWFDQVLNAILHLLDTEEGPMATGRSFEVLQGYLKVFEFGDERIGFLLQKIREMFGHPMASVRYGVVKFLEVLLRKYPEEQEIWQFCREVINVEQENSLAPWTAIVACEKALLFSQFQTHVSGVVANFVAIVGRSVELARQEKTVATYLDQGHLDRMFGDLGDMFALLYERQPDEMVRLARDHFLNAENFAAGMPGALVFLGEVWSILLANVPGTGELFEGFVECCRYSIRGVRRVADILLARKADAGEVLQLVVAVMVHNDEIEWVPPVLQLLLEYGGEITEFGELLGKVLRDLVEMGVEQLLVDEGYVRITTVVLQQLREVCQGREELVTALDRVMAALARELTSHVQQEQQTE
jgi:hypothetical protein